MDYTCQAKSTEVSRKLLQKPDPTIYPMGRLYSKGKQRTNTEKKKLSIQIKINAWGYGRNDIK